MYEEPVSEFEEGATGEATLIEDVGTEIPDENSTAEEISSFYTRLGKPSDVAGYELTAPGNLPEGMFYDEGLVGAVSQIAFEQNITTKQMQALFNVFNEHMIGQFNTDEAEYNRTKQVGEEELRTELGGNYKDYVRDAKRVFRDFSDADFFDRIHNSSLGNDPGFVRFCGKVAMELKKLGAPAGGDNDEPQYPNSAEMYAHGDTPGDAKARDHFKRKSQHKAGLKTAKEIAASGGYVPGSPHSPEMYANAEGEEGKKARAYFSSRGHTYRKIIN